MPRLRQGAGKRNRIRCRPSRGGRLIDGSAGGGFALLPVIHILMFYALLLFACGYAGLRGGAPERLVALILIAGTAATWGVTMGRGGGRADHFLDLETSVLLVDSAMLVALLAVALAADRFWPLWITALQGFGVVSHIAKAIAPEILPNVYQTVQALIAYPGLLLLIAATRWHRRRLREAGHDRSWSISWPWWTPRAQPDGPMRF